MDKVQKYNSFNVLLYFVLVSYQRGFQFNFTEKKMVLCVLVPRFQEFLTFLT
jgi:hypothetical protein